MTETLPPPVAEPFFEERPGFRPIADYGFIGDSRSGALISSQGSIDWLCWPRFDSPSTFAALLDDRVGGRFRIRPAQPYRTERAYAPNTNVLETTFHTESGSFVLRDLMPVWSESEKDHRLVPDHELLREVEVTAGEVEIELLYEPRPDYGRTAARLRDNGALGLWCRDRRGCLVLLSDLQLALAEASSLARGRERLRVGDRRYASLTYAEGDPAVFALLGSHARERIERSVAWWQEWASVCTYQGPYREAVVRSLLALKLLAYTPSGAIVAAPTTSLPEKIGGFRNWDYRYCWLRDASFTMRALFSLGYTAEAEAFLGWLLHATRLSRPELQVMYDVFGENRLRERELAHLGGYAGSQPVRVGNEAHRQLQLDIYGEVVDAAAQLAAGGTRFDGETCRLLADLGRAVCEQWKQPDEGIWEVRAGPFHHTHSKVLCWATLDRLIHMHENGLLRVDAARFHATAEEIRTQIEARGYNHQLRSYTRVFDGTELDASLLVLPYFGYADAREPRMRTTCSAIREHLGVDSLVYRYRGATDDGLPPGEGAFGVCGFWAVECQARAGDREGAARHFERLLGYANDLGLFAEETDPTTGAHLGNFPQAFTHIGLINAAITLQEPKPRRDPTQEAGQGRA